jgi:hypothetical protein
VRFRLPVNFRPYNVRRHRFSELPIGQCGRGLALKPFARDQRAPDFCISAGFDARCRIGISGFYDDAIVSNLCMSISPGFEMSDYRMEVSAVELIC